VQFATKFGGSLRDGKLKGPGDPANVRGM